VNRQPNQTPGSIPRLAARRTQIVGARHALRAAISPSTNRRSGGSVANIAWKA
jgi:hypothetical protein